MQLPAIGFGLRYEYGIFKQSIQAGWQHEQGDNWLRRPDPWEVARPDEAVEVMLNCSFELDGRHFGQCQTGHRHCSASSSTPVVGYGGKTINIARAFLMPAPGGSTLVGNGGVFNPTKRLRRSLVVVDSEPRLQRWQTMRPDPARGGSIQNAPGHIARCLRGGRDGHASVG
jgi:hypothetical protein